MASFESVTIATIQHFTIAKMNEVATRYHIKLGSNKLKAEIAEEFVYFFTRISGKENPTRPTLSSALDFLACFLSKDISENRGKWLTFHKTVKPIIMTYTKNQMLDFLDDHEVAYKEKWSKKLLAKPIITSIKKRAILLESCDPAPIASTVPEAQVQTVVRVVSEKEAEKEEEGEASGACSEMKSEKKVTMRMRTPYAQLAKVFDIPTDREISLSGVPEKLKDIRADDIFFMAAILFNYHLLIDVKPPFPGNKIRVLGVRGLVVLVTNALKYNSEEAIIKMLSETPLTDIENRDKFIYSLEILRDESLCYNIDVGTVQKYEEKHYCWRHSKLPLVSHVYTPDEDLVASLFMPAESESTSLASEVEKMEAYIEKVFPDKETRDTALKIVAEAIASEK